jgi:hypothetical protein
MTDDEINRVVSELLRKRFANAGFDRSTVETEEDFDGSSILRVTAHFKEGDVPSEQLIDALDDIRSELIGRGEDRFVFLDRAFPHEEFVDEDEE